MGKPLVQAPACVPSQKDENSWYDKIVDRELSAAVLPKRRASVAISAGKVWLGLRSIGEVRSSARTHAFSGEPTLLLRRVSIVSNQDDCLTTCRAEPRTVPLGRLRRLT